MLDPARSFRVAARCMLGLQLCYVLRIEKSTGRFYTLLLPIVVPRYGAVKYLYALGFMLRLLGMTEGV